MTNDKKIEIRSDEVQEIMGTPPKWIIRWGTLIIAMVVIVLITGSYFYKYPDLIKAPVTIMSENPPIPIVARKDGKLDKILVTDKKKVSANTILGIIENPADYEDVYALINVLNTIQDFFDSPEKFSELKFEQNYSLGLYHSYYSSFVSHLNDYQTFLRFNSYDQRIQTLNKQVDDYQNYEEKSLEEIAVLFQDYELARTQYHRDSTLNLQGFKSDVELEKSKAVMLKQQFAYQNAKTELSKAYITVNNLEGQIQEQRTEKAKTEQKLVSGLQEKYDNLVNQLRSWEQDYILRNPVEGIVTFTNFWSENQFVSNGNIVFTIVPDEDQNIIGRAFVPVIGAGKVEPDQNVNIKLDNYPHMEFGLLEGIVSNIPMVPVNSEDGDYYTVEIQLKNKLITNYKKELPFNQEMQGVAEIITKDRRLIERLIEPLVSIFRERT
jgi:HlyD family secretion protein